MLPTTAPAAAGPDLVRTSAMSAAGLARVDDTAGTIQRLDLPDAVYSWARVGGGRAAVGSRRTAASCTGSNRAATSPTVTWTAGPRSHPATRSCGSTTNPRAAAWFTAERMAVTELGGSEYLPVALHVSLDRGATWQRIPVTEDNTVEEVLAQQR